MWYKQVFTTLTCTVLLNLSSQFWSLLVTQGWAGWRNGFSFCFVLFFYHSASNKWSEERMTSVRAEVMWYSLIYRCSVCHVRRRGAQKQTKSHIGAAFYCDWQTPLNGRFPLQLFSCEQLSEWRGRGVLSLCCPCAGMQREQACVSQVWDV